MDHLNSKEDWMLFLENLQIKQLGWKLIWLHVGEIGTHGASNGPLELFSSKNYSPF